MLTQELRKRLGTQLHQPTKPPASHLRAEGANLLDATECEQQVDKLLREFDTNR